MNLVVMTGNLVEDFQERGKTYNGKIAVNNYGKTSFLYFTVLGDRATEFCRKEIEAGRLKKGSRVVIKGSLENSNYEKDGKTVYSNTLLINEIGYEGSGSRKNAEGEAAEEAPEGFEVVDDEGLPFE